MTRFIWSSQSGGICHLLTVDAHLEETAKRMTVGNPIIPYYCTLVRREIGKE